MVCVCGASVFSVLVLSHHMMVNLCQWETSFSLPQMAFTVNHHTAHAPSFHPANQTAGRSPCATCQREQKFQLGVKKHFFLSQSVSAKHFISWKRLC